MQDVGKALKGLQSDLTAGPSEVCCRCGLHLGGKLSVHIADLDQAYEQCAGESVGVAWFSLAQAMQTRKRADTVHVRKGKKVLVAYPPSGKFGRGWWSLSFGQIGRALVTLCKLTLVTLASLVVELKGCPIGGIAAASCLSAPRRVG